MQKNEMICAREKVNCSDAVVRTYSWGPEAQGAPGTLRMISDSNGVYFPAYDPNGNVMGLVKASDGTVCAQYEYLPYGEQVIATGTMAGSNPIRFSTKYRDNETGLYYYGYRYYSPDMGRWISRDISGESGGFNLYSYGPNDPNSGFDALGNFWEYFWPWSDVDYQPPLVIPPDILDIILKREKIDGYQEDVDDIDALINDLSARATDIKVLCKTISNTGKTIASFSPQAAFSEAFLGEDLAGEKVGIGTRIISGATLATPLRGGYKLIRVVGKKATIQCGELTVCVAIQRHHLIPKKLKGHEFFNGRTDLINDKTNLIDLLDHQGRHIKNYEYYVNDLHQRCLESCKTRKIDTSKCL